MPPATAAVPAPPAPKAAPSGADRPATRIDGRPVTWAEWARLVAAQGALSAGADWPVPGLA